MTHQVTIVDRDPGDESTHDEAQAWAHRLSLADELPIPIFHDEQGNVGTLDAPVRS